MQKRVIRIIMGCENREPCGNLFQKLKLLPLMSQYIFSLLLFVVHNRDQCLITPGIYNIHGGDPKINGFIFLNGLLLFILLQL